MASTASTRFGPMPVLDPAAVERFAADGFVVTQLLEPDEVERFGRAVDRAVADRTIGDDRDVADKDTYEQSFIQCMRLWETHPDVAPLTFHPRLAEAATELLDADRVRLWQDQALYKESGGRITDPHQDATFWPVGQAPMVTAWIPLDDTTLDGGAMGYVPGSHRVGPLRAVNLLHTTEPYDILSDPALGGAELRWVEAPVGSVVWHHGMTVHGARPNISGRSRRAFTVVYLADGHRRAKPWPNFPLDRAGVAVGEPMAGDGLPLAWPRADGTIPDPPAVIGQPTGPQVPVDR